VLLREQPNREVIMGRIAVVDQQNKFLRWEVRKTIHEERLFHRSIHVLAFEGDKMVIQRRHSNKQTYPAYWDMATSGHVEEEDYMNGSPDEDLEAAYLLTAQREIKEELGVEAKQLTFWKSDAPRENVHYEQMYIYLAQVKGPLKYQEEEVEALQALSKEELLALFQSGQKVTPLLIELSNELIHSGLWPTAA
jgi:isopentenyl-diphosphate delta-isomerase